MDIVNRLTDKRYLEVDELLALISTYEDKNRERAYKKLFRDNKNLIRGKVCVEAGCGMGLLTEYLIRHGAAKVYATEANPNLFQIAKKRLAQYPNIEVFNCDITDFTPSTKVDLLVHDFFGQLIFDADINKLNNLKFTPSFIMPDGCALKYGIMDVEDFDDPVVDELVMKQMKGVLVSGLFSEFGVPLKDEVLKFEFGKPSSDRITKDISNLKGNLLYLGIEISHNHKIVCQAGYCEKWSYIWTHRSGNVFKLSFDNSAEIPEPVFEWV